MPTITEYLLARLVAKGEKKDISVVFAEAEAYCHIKHPTRSADESVKRVADELYQLYPTVCYNPNRRRIAKSPSKDIPKLEKLIEKYGAGKVRDAMHACIDPGKYIPNLSKFCNNIDTYFGEHEEAQPPAAEIWQ